MTSPTDTLTLVIVPATSARTGISIFIDSSSTRVSPSLIWSPSWTTTSSTLATISARTSSAIITPFRQQAVFGVCVAQSNHSRFPQSHSEHGSVSAASPDGRFMQLKGHD
jgi:hypothetical protein